MIQIVQDDMIFRVKNSGLLNTIVVDVQYIKKIIINLLSGRTPQLCSPLTAMLNRPTTHPKKTDLYTWYPPNTIYIFEQHILLSIKRDQKNNIKTTKKKSFFDFSKGSLEPSFSRQLDLSGFPSKVKVQIGLTN